MKCLNSKYTFSGHESFPCKTLWLKKGYDFIRDGKDFNSPNAVIDLGVGKNMVSSVRFWFNVFGLNEKSNETTWIADYILNSHEGRDPYMEDLGTLWLMHFLLIYSQEASLYKLFFIDFQKERRVFNKEQVINFVRRKMIEAEKEEQFNENTIRKDVGVLLLNYCLPQNPHSNEDFSTLLMDLDLLRQSEKKDISEDKQNRYFFNIDGKKQVPPEIFLFAILLMKEDTDNSISYDLLQEIGLIFCMTDLEIIDVLNQLSKTYSESLLYSDVAGIRQLQFTKQVSAKQLLEMYYEQRV